MNIYDYFFWFSWFIMIFLHPMVRFISILIQINTIKHSYNCVKNADVSLMTNMTMTNLNNHLTSSDTPILSFKINMKKQM